MKIILLILLALTITTLNLQAEPLSGQAKLDSLLAELPKAKGDTNEVKLLGSISFGFRSTNPDKGIEYGKKGVELAKEIDWEKGEAYSYNSLGVNYQNLSDYPKALEYYQKALEINEEIGNKKGIAYNLGNTGHIYSIQSDYSKALEYYQKALEINEEIGNKNQVAVNLINIGNIYNSQSDYPKALEYYGKALKINEKLGNKKGAADNLGNMGNVYRSQSNYPKALEYHSKALKIYEELGDERSAAGTIHNIGNIYLSQSNYPKALEYYKKAKKINEKEGGNKRWLANNLGNMGLVYNRQSDYPKALEFYQKSLKINEELGIKSSIASGLGNMGGVYQRQSDYPKALEYYGKALKIDEEIGNKAGIANTLASMGNIYGKQSDYPKALEYYGKALKIDEEIGDKEGIAIILGNMGIVFQNKSDYPKALEYFGKALKINEEIGNKYMVAINLGSMGNLYLNLSQDSVNIKPDELNEFVSLNKDINLNKSIEYSLQAIRKCEEIGELHGRSVFLQNLAIAYELKGEYKKWGEALKEHHKLKDSVFNQENNDKIAALEKAREDDLNRKEIEKQKAINAEKERINQIITYITIAGFIVLIIVLIIIYRLLKRSDKLLYNVLPVSIAKRLKKKEHPISDYFTQASIVFIDIVNFTEHAKDEDPRRVVEALNKIFTKYDTISNKYGLEKIKTIGDSYMAAAGIPEVQKDNTHRAAQMALEVKAMMKDYHTADGTKIEVRIGLDCGPVVAGVIGENKFIYDMWSDAVNTASRMESSSIAGEVHVSERFKEAVTEYEEFSYVERGEIEIKGKGKMKTFFMGSKTEVV